MPKLISSLPINIHPEVQQALSEHKPIVALESTVITHGLPKPVNYQVAMALEEDVRKAGATPATIYINDGMIQIGMTTDALAMLSEAQGVFKASTRDLAYLLANKKVASTTVAATMICANLTGISWFATGGLGGVHRGASDSFDISADLIELSRTPVNVVCAGCKSILDIGKTLEMLETLSVPILSYGQDEFPAFYSSKSGFSSPQIVNTVEQIVEVVAYQKVLGLKSGIIITNPIPVESALSEAELEAPLKQAIDQANSNNITGKALTPFLLNALNEIAGDKILQANIALIRNNARLAAQIAVRHHQAVLS